MPSKRALVPVLVWFASLLPAQQYEFRVYSQADGLGNLSIFSLWQCRTGYIWAGTANGLFRYDGQRFVRFGEEDGLPGMTVLSISEDDSGVLWIGTRTGLARANGDRFEAVTMAAGGPHVSGLAASGQRLYVATNLGLVERSPDGHFREIQPSRPEGRGRAWGVHASAQGVVWWGCGKAVCRLDDGEIEVLGEERGLPSDGWGALITDGAGRLWVRSSRRMAVLEPGVPRFRDAGGNLPESLQVLRTNLDRRGRLWVPTDRGLARLTGGDWELLGKRHGLPIDAARVAMEDRDGSLWLGMAGAGLARWRGYGEWASFTENQGLPSDRVWTFARGGGDRLWAGTDSGLAWLENGTWRQFNGMTACRVASLAAAPDGALWIGCNPGGVRILRPGAVRAVALGPGTGIQDDRIMRIALDASGTAWVATITDLYRGDGRTFTKVLGGARALAIAADGAVWAGGAGGLWRIEGGQMTHLTSRDGLRTETISSLAEDPTGAIWIGYREPAGLSRLHWDPAKVRIDHLSLADGLPSNVAYFLGIDKRGWVWAGSDRGVTVYDGQRRRHFDDRDGLVWNDTNQNSFWADGDGAVWIGTSRGASRVHLRETLFEPRELEGPPLVISSLWIGGRRHAAGDTPRVPFDQAHLTAQFSALDFASESSTRFRYRIEGLGEEWIESSRGEARYSKLPPGEYTFEAAARGVAGAWTDPPARLAFVIEEPWWQAPWYRALLASAAALLAYLAWRRREHRMLQVQRTLETSVEQRTGEIQRLLVEAQENARLKSQFLATMSHEIRTPVNGLLGMTRLAVEADTPEQRQECLQLAEASAESLASIVDDILDFSKVEAGKMRLESSRFDIRRLYSEAVKTLEPRAKQKGLDLRLDVDPAVPEILVGDPHRLRQVLVNLLGNAIKFTARGSVELRLRTDADLGASVQLLTSVCDTGIGISREMHTTIFDPFRQADETVARRYGGAGLGLAISSELVSLMHGHIWLESTAGDGSTFYFTVTLGKAPPQSPLEPPPRRLRVLLAEDNPINQKLASRLLEKRGHEVTVAADGHEALAAFEGGAFDAILMDIQMPGLDGIDVTARIREREKGTGRRVAVIAMTANAVPGDRERCLASGMDAYLSKPVHPPALFEVLDSVAGPG